MNQSFKFIDANFFYVHLHAFRILIKKVDHTIYDIFVEIIFFSKKRIITL